MNHLKNKICALYSEVNGRADSRHVHVGGGGRSRVRIRMRAERKNCQIFASHQAPKTALLQAPHGFHAHRPCSRVMRSLAAPCKAHTGLTTTMPSCIISCCHVAFFTTACFLMAYVYVGEVEGKVRILKKKLGVRRIK